MLPEDTTALYALLDLMADPTAPPEARSLAYQAWRREFVAESDVRQIEMALFEQPERTEKDRAVLVNLLVVAGNDDAWNVLVRVIDDDASGKALKNQAAKNLLRLNEKRAWKILRLTGPSWLEPLTVVTATPIDRQNGPGYTGGVHDALFEHIAIGTGEHGYGRDPDDSGDA